MSSEVLQYISIMSGAASAGDLTIELQTYDLISNLTLTLNVSGIAGTETPFQLANTINTQLNTYIVQNSANYPNTPPSDSYNATAYFAFPDQVCPAKFSVTRTDHVVCLMSQANFSVSITENETGCQYSIKPNPALVTLEQLRQDAEVAQVSLTDADGNDLTDANLIRAIEIASARLTRFLRNNIVSTTYLETFICGGTRGITVKKTPIIDFYPLTVRYPSTYFSGYIYMPTASASKYNFAIGREKGSIYYRYAQDMFSAVEPFDIGNEVMVAYISGYRSIPVIIQESILQFVNLLSVQIGSGEYKSMSSEGFKVEYDTEKDFFATLKQTLSEFFCA